MSQDTTRAGRAGEREQLIAGIEQSRQDLVRTVQALSAKVDVPARVERTDKHAFLVTPPTKEAS